MFEIKSGIPVPANTSGRPQTSGILYPYAAMDVGTCFFVANGDRTDKQSLARVRASLFRWRKTAADSSAVKFRIASYPHPDTTLPAVGVWRTV